MCRIISVASCKGGVAKTTSTINIGTSLALQGKKVLVVDNDPQGNLTTYLNVKSKIKYALPVRYMMIIM